MTQMMEKEIVPGEIEVRGIVDEHTGPFWWYRAVERCGATRVEIDPESGFRDSLLGWGTVRVTGVLTTSQQNFTHRLMGRLGVMKWLRSIRGHESA